MIHYGQSLHPLLDSLPEVFYKTEDLYISRQWGIRLEEWMGYRRTVSEAEMLAEMACNWVLPPGEHHDVPNLALVDGSLIYWFLDGLPVEARDKILPPILASCERLRETNIPMMGYVSASRSTEGLNFLRLHTCEHEHPNCVVHCSDLLDKYPCQKIDSLRDSSFWAHQLQPGQRSPLCPKSSLLLCQCRCRDRSDRSSGLGSRRPGFVRAVFEYCAGSSTKRLWLSRSTS